MSDLNCSIVYSYNFMLNILKIILCNCKLKFSNHLQHLKRYLKEEELSYKFLRDIKINAFYKSFADRKLKNSHMYVEIDEKR